MKTHLRRGDNGFASYVGLADHPLLSEEDFFGRNLRQQKKRTKKRETFTNGTAVRKTQNVCVSQVAIGSASRLSRRAQLEFYFVCPLSRRTSIPKSPRATIMPSVASRMAS